MQEEARLKDVSKSQIGKDLDKSCRMIFILRGMRSYLSNSIVGTEENKSHSESFISLT